MKTLTHEGIHTLVAEGTAFRCPTLRIVTGCSKLHDATMSAIATAEALAVAGYLRFWLYQSVDGEDRYVGEVVTKTTVETKFKGK